MFSFTFFTAGACYDLKNGVVSQWKKNNDKKAFGHLGKIRLNLFFLKILSEITDEIKLKMSSGHNSGGSNPNSPAIDPNFLDQCGKFMKFSNFTFSTLIFLFY